MISWALFNQWDFQPTVVSGCLLLGAGYLAWVQFKPKARAAAFFAGLGVLVIALLSPIDGLGDIYLFSVHMIQHLMLILISAPLIVIGLPEAPLRRVLEPPMINRLEQRLSQPAVACLIDVSVVWIWHLPPFYNLALANESVHAFQHLTFLVGATIFWWPVFTPLEERRIPAPMVLLYIFLASLGNAILGIILTFVPAGLYPNYLYPADPWHVLAILRNTWGITPQVDQQLGGLAMWVPGSLIYLAAILGCLLRWYNNPEPETLVSTYKLS